MAIYITTIKTKNNNNYKTQKQHQRQQGQQQGAGQVNQTEQQGQQQGAGGFTDTVTIPQGASNRGSLETYYHPVQITIPSSTSVTWDNQDSASHTATAIDNTMEKDFASLDCFENVTVRVEKIPTKIICLSLVIDFINCNNNNYNCTLQYLQPDIFKTADKKDEDLNAFNKTFKFLVNIILQPKPNVHEENKHTSINQKISEIDCNFGYNLDLSSKSHIFDNICIIQFISYLL